MEKHLHKKKSLPVDKKGFSKIDAVLNVRFISVRACLF